MQEEMQTMRLDVIANVISQVTSYVVAKVTWCVYNSVSKVEREIHFRAPCIWGTLEEIADDGESGWGKLPPQGNDEKCYAKQRWARWWDTASMGFATKVLDHVVCHWKAKLFVIFFYDGLCFAVLFDWLCDENYRCWNCLKILTGWKWFECIYECLQVKFFSKPSCSSWLESIFQICHHLVTDLKWYRFRTTASDFWLQFVTKLAQIGKWCVGFVRMPPNFSVKLILNFCVVTHLTTEDCQWKMMTISHQIDTKIRWQSATVFCHWNHSVTISYGT